MTSKILTARAQRRRFITIYNDWVGKWHLPITDADIETFGDVILVGLGVDFTPPHPGLAALYDRTIGHRTPPSDSDITRFGLVLEAAAATNTLAAPLSSRRDTLIEASEHVLEQLRKSDAALTNDGRGLSTAQYSGLLGYRKGMQEAAIALLELAVDC